MENFESIATALQAIMTSNSIFNIPANLKDHLTPISNLLAEPELYAEQANIPAFTVIVMSRIAKKIQEFKGFNADQERRYIEEQSQTPPQPGSTAHTISEEQMLREANAALDAQERNEFLPPNSQGLVDEAHTVLDISREVNYAIPATQGLELFVTYHF